MEIQKFYVNQEQFGEGLRTIIDMYIEKKLNDRQMVENVKEIISLNKEKFYLANGNIAEKVKRKVGKKRLEIVLKALNF